MKKYYLNELSDNDYKELLKRPAVDLEKAFTIIRPILSNVKQQGLKAALRYAHELDSFTGKTVFTSRNEFICAEEILPSKVKKAIKTAYDNIYRFHLPQTAANYTIKTADGVICSREYRAIESVGLYIPGGTAVLPSTVLMLGIPAQIAKVPRVVLFTPVKGERVNNAVLYAAELCGIKEVIKIGGAQAIALMAYGDEILPKVNKIFGPGNQYITAAKMQVSISVEGLAIDMPSGPSEVLIIADDNADPAFVAADLLSQAEHGADSQSVLITDSIALSNKVNKEIKNQLGLLERKEFAQKSLAKSFTLIVNNISEAFDFSNQYAPEHLIINTVDAANYKQMIINAGSVFIGAYAPESAGDYASGTNHSLPTSGYASSFGGVSVESFMKTISFQELTKEGLKNISSAVEILAETEGLTAHKNAVSIRIN